jgi:hypothetical protein
VDPFDRSKCSFPVPEFESEEQEREWVLSLSGQQRLELLRLTRLWRWGEEVISQPIDWSYMRVMTMTEEFRALKDQEDAAEDRWRAEHGLPPRFAPVSKEQRPPARR